MQSVLLHAKSSPSHWRSVAFSSHLCGLSRGQGWKVCSSGQNVDLTSHFLQCATSVIHNMTLSFWALFNACHPSAPYVLLKLNVWPRLSPSLQIFLRFALWRSAANVTRSQPSAPFLCISLWDEKQLFSPQGPGHPAFQPTCLHPPALLHSSPFPQVLLLLWHLEAVSYILKFNSVYKGSIRSTFTRLRSLSEPKYFLAGATFLPLQHMPSASEHHPHIYLHRRHLQSSRQRFAVQQEKWAGNRIQTCSSQAHVKTGVVDSCPSKYILL